jgi:hypothetical protein
MARTRSTTEKAFTVDTGWDEMVFTFTQAYDESVLDFEE